MNFLEKIVQFTQIKSTNSRKKKELEKYADYPDNSFVPWGDEEEEEEDTVDEIHKVSVPVKRQKPNPPSPNIAASEQHNSKSIPNQERMFIQPKDTGPSSSKQNQIEKRKNYEPVGLKVGETSFTITRIKDINNTKKAMPREDGKLWNSNTINSANDFYGQEYIKEEEERRNALEEDYNYRFVCALAGALNFSTVAEIFQDQIDPYVARREKALLQSQSNTINQSNLSIADLSLELHKLKNDNQIVIERMTKIDILLQRLNKILTQYIVAYNNLEEFSIDKAYFKDKELFESLYNDFNTNFDIKAIFSDGSNVSKGDLLNVWGVLYRLAAYILRTDSTEQSIDYTEEDILRIYNNVLDESENEVFSDDLKEEIVHLIRFIEKHKDLDINSNLNREQSLFRSFFSCFHRLVCTLYLNGVLLIDPEDLWEQYNGVITSINLGTIANNTEDGFGNKKELNTNEYMKLYAKYGETKFLPFFTYQKNYKEKSTIPNKGNSIRDYYTPDFSIREFNEMNAQIPIPGTNQLRNKHDVSTYTDQYAQVLRSYINILKRIREKKESKQSKIQEEYNALVMKIQRIRKGEVVLETPEVPYNHRRSWVEKPENSGIFRCIPVVVHAIDSAYQLLKEKFLWCHKIDVEFLQRDVNLKPLFVNLCATIVCRSAIKFPKRYTQLKNKQMNTTDLINCLQAFAKYTVRRIRKGNRNVFISEFKPNHNYNFNIALDRTFIL